MKRYEYEPDPYGECACCVVEKADGEWVKFEDVEKLIESRKLLVKAGGD